MGISKNKEPIDSVLCRKNYWNSFYAGHSFMEPTPFALFCLKYFDPKSMICDLGCGNGRDTLFFSQKCHGVVAVDFSSTAIESVLSHGKNNVTGLCSDASNLGVDKFDAVYSRFSLHSMTEAEEDKVLTWVHKAVTLNGFFCVEVRSDKLDQDETFYFGDGHYRRFVNFETIKKKIEKVGFELLYAQEDHGFAIFKDEDPLVIRIIGRKR